MTAGMSRGCGQLPIPASEVWRFGVGGGNDALFRRFRDWRLRAETRRVVPKERIQLFH